MARPTTTETLVYYWGEGGQYGPFAAQEEGEWAGWPNFGQVMRYFRKKIKPKLSAKAFGVLYGETINADGSAIGERWILDMELENKVPVDINKRKTIARLLQIPPMLFGLATLEDLKLEPHPQVQTVMTGQTKLVKVAADTTRYQHNIRTIWQLHKTGNAQGSISQLYSDIKDIESLEQQAQGDLRFQFQETLIGNHLVATHVIRDQRKFSQAYYHANEAVRVAKAMQDSDLIATALFTRGWTSLEWGLFGTMKHNIFQISTKKVHLAIGDFQNALDEKEIHPQLKGLLSLFLGRAEAVLAINKGQKPSAPSLLALDDAADAINCQSISDPYTQLLITGTRTGLHTAGYHDMKAIAFNSAGLAGQALKELTTLEKIVEKAYGRDETRQHAWLDILRANVYIGLEEFGVATTYAKQALLACQDICSITNTAIITDIYGKLLNSRYKSSRDVQELGDILRESPTIFIESEE